MKISFGIKFGALMLIAIMALVGSILVFFSPREHGYDEN